MQFLLIATALVFALYAGRSVAAGSYAWVVIPAMPFLLAFMARPDIGILGFVALYPLLPYSEGISILELISAAFVGILAFTWFFDTQFRGRKTYSPHRIDHLFLAWFGWLVLSLVVFLSNGGMVLGWVRDLVPFANMLLLLPAKDYFTDTRKTDGLFRLMVGVTCFVGVGYFLRLVGLRLPFFSAHGTPFHPVVLLLCGLALVTAARRFEPLGITALVIAMGQGLVTDNRTVSIAVIVAGILYLLAVRASGGVVVAGFVLLFAGYLLYIGVADYQPQKLEYKRERMESLLRASQDISVQSRMDEARECWRLFMDHPYFGVGLGYEYRFWRHYVAGVGQGFMKTNFTHSDFMNLLAKTGIVGASLWLAFLITLLRIGWEIVARSKDLKRRTIAAALTVSVAMSQVVGQSTPVLQAREASYLLAVVIGLLICLHRQEMEAREAEAATEAREA